MVQKQEAAAIIKCQEYNSLSDCDKHSLWKNEDGHILLAAMMVPAGLKANLTLIIERGGEEWCTAPKMIFFSPLSILITKLGHVQKWLAKPDDDESQQSAIFNFGILLRWHAVALLLPLLQTTLLIALYQT